MKKNTNNMQQNNKMDKVAVTIAATILKWQQRYASALETITKHWQQGQQWIFLCLIGLAFGGSSILFLVNSFRQSPSPNLIITKSISLPKHIYAKGKSLQITEKEFQKVQDYKHNHTELFMDRPGLYDTLQQIEEMYYSQKK